MLDLKGIEAGYGETRVLHGLDLTLRAGTVHALLGRNGVGKSTTLKAIAGQLPLTKGQITLDGTLLSGRKPHAIARQGIAYVPETRDIFGSLTVRENLALAGRRAGPGADWTIPKITAFFPNLAPRLETGGLALSGGEQQMLAIARALMAAPRVMLLDEPTEGLAPIVIQQIRAKLTDLKAAGLTLLLVEQNLPFALSLADDVSLMSRGQIVWHGTADALRADDAAHRRWLGV